MSLVRAAGHAVRRGAVLTARRPRRALWAIGSVAAAVLAFAVVAVAAQNLAAWTATWKGGASLVVYLHPGVADDQARRLAAELEGAAGIERIELVPPAEAGRRLLSALGSRGDLLDGVDPTALPSSLEITLAPGVRDVAAASPVVDALRASALVEDVELTGEWVDEVGGLLAGLRAGAGALATLLGALAIWSVVAAVRLRFNDLGAEARVGRLFGAPSTFVRIPAMLAGAALALTGAGLALGVARVAQELVAADVAAAAGRVFGNVQVRFLSLSDAALVLLAAGGLGLVGGLLASGRDATA